MRLGRDKAFRDYSLDERECRARGSQGNILSQPQTTTSLLFSAKLTSSMVHLLELTFLWRIKPSWFELVPVVDRQA